MVSDWQGGDISKLFPALSGKEDLSMGEDKKADKKRKRIVPKAPVQRLSTVYSIHVIIMQETEEASVVPTI